MCCETGKDPFFKQGLLITSQKTTKSSINEFCWPDEVKACFSWKAHQPTYSHEGHQKKNQKNQYKLLFQLPDKGVVNCTIRFVTNSVQAKEVDNPI